MDHNWRLKTADNRNYYACTISLHTGTGEGTVSICIVGGPAPLGPVTCERRGSPIRGGQFPARKASGGGSHAGFRVLFIVHGGSAHAAVSACVATAPSLRSSRAADPPRNLLHRLLVDLPDKGFPRLDRRLITHYANLVGLY